MDFFFYFFFLFRYLLIFGERKKKVEFSVTKGVENVKVMTLRQEAMELFNLKNVLLQIWDKGFEDWVDLDEGDPTPTNSRVKVEVDKEAIKSALDISIADRTPSKSAAVKPTCSSLVGTPKPIKPKGSEPPKVRVLSSYPMVTLTKGAPNPKSLPALALIRQPQSQAPGKPRRILPVAQVKISQTPVRASEAPVRTPQGPVRASQTPVRTAQAPVRASEAPVRTSHAAPVRTPQAPGRTPQAPGRASASSAGETMGARQDVEDDR